MRPVAAGLFAILLASPVSAATVIQVAGANLHEELSERVDVSGEVRVGVLAGGARPKDAEAVRLFVQVPRSDARRLCVRLSSRDGRYRAEAFAVLSGSEGNELEIVLATQHKDVLRELGGENDLAALVSLTDADNCRGRIPLILPARWSVGEADDSLTVFVNSGGLTTRLRYRDGEESRSVECEAIRGGPVLAFDSRCRLAKMQNASAFYLERQDFADLEQIPLPLARQGP